MRLLSLCFPNVGKTDEVHLNSRADAVVLAPDEFLRLLREVGWHVDVVSLAKPTNLPLFRSGLPLLRLKDVQPSSYDLLWHMFRDPTPPEALERLQRQPLDYGKARIVNAAQCLQNHNKLHYLPVLARHGVGVEPCGNDLSIAEWQKDTDLWISRDRKYIATHAYNSNRGVYPEWGHGRIVTRYIDNAAGGFRTFVRFGYAFGQGFSGFRYYLPESNPAARTGAAVRYEPYVVPEKLRPKISQAMNALGCDVCHLEAIPKDDDLRICDVNPNPTANGRTLTPITQSLVDIIDRVMRLRSA
jgi:hypothetical protein